MSNSQATKPAQSLMVKKLTQWKKEKINREARFHQKSPRLDLEFKIILSSKSYKTRIRCSLAVTMPFKAGTFITITYKATIHFKKLSLLME